MTRADGRIQGDFNSEGGSRTSVATNSEKGITAIGWPPLFLPAKEEEKPPRWRGTNLPVGPHLRSSNDGFHGSCSPVKDSGCITYLQTPMMKTFRTVIKGAAKQLGDEVSKQQPILAGQRGPQLGSSIFRRDNEVTASDLRRSYNAIFKTLNLNVFMCVSNHELSRHPLHIPFM